MSSSYHGNISFSVFGQSHSPAIGITVEGLPYGFSPDMEKLKAFMSRRAPGQNEYSTPRKEADEPVIISGLKDGCICGAPFTALIYNTNTRSKDYSALKNTPRPGHADYTAEMKYQGFQDYAGGGHFSARLTAPLCLLGGLCIQLLEQDGIQIQSRIKAIAGVLDPSELAESTAGKAFPVVDDAVGEKMRAAIAAARAEGDSVGGIIECVIRNVPVGIGDPMLDGLENRIARFIFAIPAVRGIEFGTGFAASEMKGSEHNDAFCMKNGTVQTETNHCGGILGGISNGMPICFRVAFKPTPSISKTQHTVDLNLKEDTLLNVVGRHDPCVVPRAVPCVEAMAAIALYDAILEEKKYRR